MATDPKEIPGTLATLQFGRDTDVWKEFYSLVGYCINQWSTIDRCLYDCCAQCLATDERKVSIVYYQNANFDFRKKLVTELMDISLVGDELINQWSEVLKEVTRLQSFRNIIAHQPIQQQGEIIWDLHAEGGPKLHAARTWLHVTIEEKELLRGKKQPQTITVEDLRTHAEEATALSGAMQAFVTSFKTSLAMLRQSPPQASESSQGQAEHRPLADPEPRQ